MTEKTSSGQSGVDGWDTSDTDSVPTEEPQTEKALWVSERLHDIIDAEPIDECKCGKPRVRVTFRNGFKISVHDDGSFIQWTGEMG